MYQETNNLADDSFVYGIVESTNDPRGLHRVKVRIIGIHNQNRTQLPTSDLPWAIVANSTSSSTTKHNLKPGAFVVCKFLDPIDQQQPIVLFSLFSKITSSGVLYNSIRDMQNPGAVFIGKSNIIPDQTLYDQKIPQQVIAKSQPINNIANPLGQNINVPVANGKNGGVGMFADIEREIISLGNIFKYVKLYDVDDITLSADIDEIVGFIPLSRTTNIPPSGIVQIGDEIITYVGVADTGLSGQILRGSPPRDSFISTKAVAHKRGEVVKWLYPLVKNDRSPIFYSQITNQAIDFAKEIKKRVKVISGYVTWLMSRVSGQLTQLLSELILEITTVLKSPVALVGSVIVDALLKILSQILCLFGLDTVESLVAFIEKLITDQVNALISAVYANGQMIQDFITSCSNKIFDAILQFASIVQSIGNLITDVTKVFPGVVSGGNKLIRNISGEFKISLADITKTAGVVAMLLGLLGVGCTTPIGENIGIYNDYGGSCAANYYPNGINCASNPDVIGALNGLWRPLPQFITSHDFGGGITVEHDATPGSERTLINHPGGTYTEVLNDGTTKTVITKDNYQLILQDNYVEIKGDCAMKVDGDFSLKVSGNMDLEIGKQMRTSIGGASQISYGGSHTTNYFGDSTINAVNKLSIVGTQIGLSASGVVDIGGGVFNVLTNEINLSSAGSLSLMSLYGNNITAISHREIHSGISDTLVVGNQNKINLGTYSGKIVGGHDVAYLGTKTTNVTGVHSLNNIGLYNISSNIKLEKTIGLDQSDSNLKITNSNMKLDTIAGASINYSEGINLRSTSGGINFDS